MIREKITETGQPDHAIMFTVPLSLPLEKMSTIWIMLFKLRVENTVLSLGSVSLMQWSISSLTRKLYICSKRKFILLLLYVKINFDNNCKIFFFYLNITNSNN